MSVHRIRIRADRGGDPVALDVALPSAAPVGELLPAILDLVGDGTPPEAAARAWRLDRPSGGTLVESLSLRDNHVHDGELLILTPDRAPQLGLIHLEPCGQVASAQLPTHARGAGRDLSAVCVLAATVAAIALAWSGVGAPSLVNLIVAAIGTCATTVAALTVGHPTALGVAAAVLAAATGFLVVPSVPSAAHAFLASVAAFAASLLVLRFSGHPSRACSGMATLAMLIGIATLLTMPVAAVASVLATASLGVLALSPRLAVLLAGLGPEHWIDEMDIRAATGHATLTGLVAGCAAGAAIGAALTAVAAVRYGHPSGSAVAFSGVVALVLVLRARTHADPLRRILLTAAGLLSGTASFVIFAAVYSHHVGWAGGALVMLAVVTGRRPRMGAVMSRMADRLEYAALAAVIPVGLWVGGAFTLMGTVRLP